MCLDITLLALLFYPFLWQENWSTWVKCWQDIVWFLKWMYMFIMHQRCFRAFRLETRKNHCCSNTSECQPRMETFKIFILKQIWDTIYRWIALTAEAIEKEINLLNAKQRGDMSSKIINHTSDPELEMHQTVELEATSESKSMTIAHHTNGVVKVTAKISHGLAFSQYLGRTMDNIS